MLGFDCCRRFQILLTDQANKPAPAWVNFTKFRTRVSRAAARNGKLKASLVLGRERSVDSRCECGQPLSTMDLIALAQCHGFRTEGQRVLAVWEFLERRLHISILSPEDASW